MQINALRSPVRRAEFIKTTLPSSSSLSCFIFRTANGFLQVKHMQLHTVSAGLSHEIILVRCTKYCVNIQTAEVEYIIRLRRLLQWKYQWNGVLLYTSRISWCIDYHSNIRYIFTWCHPVLHIFEPFFQLYTVRTSYKRITLLEITLRCSKKF